MAFNMFPLYNRMYLHYKKQQNIFYNIFINKMHYYQLYALIQYGKIVSNINICIERISNNRIYTIIKSFSNYFFTNTESHTHWMRNISYYIPLESQQVKWPFFKSIYEKNIRFITTYNNYNIKTITHDNDFIKSFNNNCDNMIQLYKNEKNICYTLITMKTNNRYIHRIINNNNIFTHHSKIVENRDSYTNLNNISGSVSCKTLDLYYTNTINNTIAKLKYIEPTDKHFIYVSYIHPKLDTNISIILTDHYFYGNDILSNAFIYNYLYMNGQGHLYDIDYHIEILDSDFNKTKLKSNEYITIYKSYYIVKEMTIKMI